MGTIKKQIESLIFRELDSFEASHDNDICAYVDFIYRVSDKFAVGFALMKSDSTVSHLRTATLNDFEAKFGGLCYIVRYDAVEDKITNPEILKDALRAIVEVQKEINFLATIKEMGLSENDAIIFMDLLKELKPTKNQLENYEATMNSAIPFEGGMFLGEALTGLYFAIK